MQLKPNTIYRSEEGAKVIINKVESYGSSYIKAYSLEYYSNIISAYAGYYFKQSTGEYGGAEGRRDFPRHLTSLYYPT